MTGPKACGVRYSAAKVLRAGERACLADGIEPTATAIALRLRVNREAVHRWRSGRIATVRPSTADHVEMVTGVYVGHLELTHQEVPA